MEGRRRGRGWLACWMLGVFLVAAGAGALEPGSPEDTVRNYLRAMKDGKFDDVYDLVSKAMRGGKEREVWVREQKAGMAFADVKIFEFEVHPGKVEGEKAYVPNVLSSQDRFINQLGLTEHELWDPLESTCRHASLSIL